MTRTAAAVAIGSVATILAIGATMDLMGEDRFVDVVTKAWPPLRWSTPGSVASYAVGLGVLVVLVWRVRR
jgi:hypothetical protein